MTKVLSTSYGFGDDPELDELVPREVVDLFCGANDCLVTQETSPIDPEDLERKYYARGVGWILAVSPRTGEIVRLVGCNFDPRCDALGAP